MENKTVKSLVMGSIAGATGGVATALGAILGITSYGTIWPVAVICSILGALIHHTKQSANELVDNRMHTLKNRVDKIRRDVGDIHGLVRLAPYTQDLPLPIGGGWALTGDSAALLAREVLVRKPHAILELGSGVSTLILGQIIKRNGVGHLLSIDHDPVWATQTRKLVDTLGLADVITVVDAPLKTMTIGNRTAKWYDIPENALNNFGAIDLLFVDGPPQPNDQTQAARYPAFPLLRKRLTPDALIFVDDAHRPTESSMVAQWQVEDPDWNALWFDTTDGVCLLTRKP